MPVFLCNLLRVKTILGVIRSLKDRHYTELWPCYVTDSVF